MNDASLRPGQLVKALKETDVIFIDQHATSKLIIVSATNKINFPFGIKKVLSWYMTGPFGISSSPI